MVILPSFAHMPVLSRLIITHKDPRAVAALRFGFESRGARVDVIADGAEVTALLDPVQATAKPSATPQLIIADSDSPTDGLALLGELRRAVKAGGRRVPILYLGAAASHDEALSAGASARLAQPAFLRDVVTVARLLANPKRNSKVAFGGELSDYGTPFLLIRAIIALRRSAILSMVRGLRRGEIRFYKGEVTSAQVGTLHGLAAFHQLLLWTQANFELRYDRIVRRQQIPLTPAELLADAARFLAEVRATLTELDPALLYGPNRALIEESNIPSDVRRVLQLIDGRRAFADILKVSNSRNGL
ncbi:MAG: DUF4388 domain-containing protein, partial [Myxococcota bacterium]